MPTPDQNFAMNPIQNPCKDCPKQGCGRFHDKCEKYLQFRKDVENYRIHRRELDENSGYYGAKPLGHHYVPKKFRNKNNPFSL